MISLTVQMLGQQLSMSGNEIHSSNHIHLLMMKGSHGYWMSF